MASEEQIIRVLGGGEARRGRKTGAGIRTLRDQVRAGFRFSTLEAFRRRYRISHEQLRELIDISERTIARRK